MRKRERKEKYESTFLDKKYNLDKGNKKKEKRECGNPQRRASKNCDAKEIPDSKRKVSLETKKTLLAKKKFKKTLSKTNFDMLLRFEKKK